MKVSLNWVKQFTEVNLSIDELVKKIGDQLGAVEEVINLGKVYQHIVIAEVVSCEKHPDADKLSVCIIDDGGVVDNITRDENGHVQVVCGAPNVREGLKVAWLPPGTTVPSTLGKDPFVLSARELRGITSNGMLASAAELAIGDDHTGIVELDDHAVPGADFAETYELNDYIIDIENKMFTHRPDCFGILGVAREIAGIQGIQFNSPNWYLDKINFALHDEGLTELEVKNLAGKLVPRFMAAAINGIKIAPSAFKMQTYLSRVGLKPINNIVDVTNYIMYLTGQPTHAYDADKLRKISGSDLLKLETRMSRSGDKLRLINGKDVDFEDDSTILITSNDVPVGIGGVMGGFDTEVDGDTKNIVLECANFDMYTVRRSSMKYGLFTDAVTRFNKGQSSLQNLVILNKTIEMVKSHAGGQLSSKVVDIKENLESNKPLEVGVDFVNSRLGLSLSASEMTELLTNVEFAVQSDEHRIIITSPFWRTDIEIPEDIVEEVGRLYGYDNLPLQLPKRSIKPVVKDDMLSLKSEIREILFSAGANEILSYNFVHGKLLDQAGQKKEVAYEINNSLSPDLQYYRLSLLPGMLEKARINVKSGIDEFVLFEIGKSHSKLIIDEETKLPDEQNSLEVFYTSTKPRVGAAYYQMLNTVDYSLSRLGVKYFLKPIEEDFYQQAFKIFDIKRSAYIMNATDRGGMIGVVGELKSSVISSFKLPEYTAAALIDLDGPSMQASNRHVDGVYKQLSKFQSIHQDITLRAPENINYAKIYYELNKGLKTLIDDNYRTSIEPVDIYQKANSNYKHFTFRLKIAHYEKTLKSSDVNEILDRLADKVGQKLGAERL